MTSTPDFIKLVLGERKGKLAVAFGRNPYFDATGKYKFRDWSDHHMFTWPDELAAFLEKVNRETSNGVPVDVYINPAVRHINAKKRRKGDAIPPMVCWADLDQPATDKALYDTLNPLAVNSGQPGHVHAYVPLTRPVGLLEHRALQEALRDRLGGDDKIADNDVLRWPGSLNWKPAVSENSDSQPAKVEIQPGTPAVWEPDDLAELLGVHLGGQGRGHLSDQGNQGGGNHGSQAEPYDIAGMPEWLRKRFADAANPEDRSQAFHGLVGACRDAGLTQGQTVTVMRDWKPGVDKYGDRIADEVARCWGKVAGGDRSRNSALTGGAKFKPNPGRYFIRGDGLKAATLARDIITMGPLAEGLDDIMWSYADGVWLPNKHVVRARAALLLDELYRRSHGANAEDVVRARVARITCDPITEVINFTNGLYYWRLDELRDHTPEVHSTVQLPVNWEPSATCPEFETFIAQVVPADMIPVVWELLGYLMYSGNPLHKAVMFMGHGRNGKGTLLRVANALLGEHNVTSVSLHDLVNTRFSTASLFGKIANVAGDIDGGYLESTATFKAITGQDMISAEHKGRDRFDFTPWAVPVFSANKIPASADTTVGYLSRWLVIPFPHDFTGREDRTLDARLQTKAELQGIAAKAMPALRRLLDRGEFEVSESGTSAKDEFARRVDQVRTWVDDCAELGDYPFVYRTTLYQAYKAWAIRDGHKPVRASEFYDRLSSIPGIAHTRRGNGERGFTGLKITDQAGSDPWNR